MIGNAKIAVALVGGYLLGRTKKAKLAVGLGMFLAGRRLNLDPGQLARTLTSSPVLGGLNDQVRRELVDATKSAATAALTDRANRVADSLHERTLTLGGEDRADDADEADDEPDDGREPDEELPDEEPEPERKAARARPKKPASAARKPAGQAAQRTARASSRVPSKAPAARRTRRKAASGGQGGDDG